MNLQAMLAARAADGKFQIVAMPGTLHPQPKAGMLEHVRLGEIGNKQRPAVAVRQVLRQARAG